VSPNIKKQRRVAGTQGGYRPILNNPTGRIRRKGR
jgi:hypothetical protein